MTPTAEEEEPAAYSDLNPAWSPDGSQILFQSNRPTHEGEVVKGDPDIYVIKADGSDGLGGGTLLPASAVSEQVPPPPEEPIEEGPPPDVPPEDPGGEPPLPDSDITPDWQTIATSNLAVSLVDTPDPVEAGQNVTYEATLANGGPSFTTGASLVLQVPSTTTFASVTSSQGVCTGQGPVSCVHGLDATRVVGQGDDGRGHDATRCNHGGRDR